MNTVKLALVGAGVIGQRHLKALDSLAGSEAELVAIADPGTASVELANDKGVPHFSDTKDLFDTVKPDGVIVAAPTEHHLTPTLACLKAGSHVLVEKPIMATIAEAEQVIELATHCQKHVLVGHQRRYYSRVHKARELIREGRLGKLVAVHGQWNLRKPDSYYESDWRKAWQAGPVLTNLIHEIDYLRYICGDIDSIVAETSNLVQGFEKEDVAALLIRFKSGALGTFMLSDQTNSPWTWEFATGENINFATTGQNAIRFMGTEASLDFPNLQLWHQGDAEASWHEPFESEKFELPLEDAYVQQLQHFIEVIRGNAEPVIDAQDATETLRATVAVFEAARERKWVQL